MKNPNQLTPDEIDTYSASDKKRDDEMMPAKNYSGKIIFWLYILVLSAIVCLLFI
jgi:hypothetical protein